MLNIQTAQDRATRRAIETGEAVNLHVIHATQRAEGYQPCFGRAVEPCTQSDCAYYDTCMALTAFEPAPLITPSASGHRDALPFERRNPSQTLLFHRAMDPVIPAFRPIVAADALE